MGLVVTARFASLYLLALLQDLEDNSIALFRVRSFALPISIATSTATIILPVITGVTLRGAQSLLRGSHKGRNDNKYDFSLAAMIMVMLLFIYDTVIATLALTYIVPPSDLNCHLEGRWAWLFSHKNADVIRRIQDRHQCCGDQFSAGPSVAFSRQKPHCYGLPRSLWQTAELLWRMEAR